MSTNDSVLLTLMFMSISYVVGYTLGRLSPVLFPRRSRKRLFLIHGLVVLILVSAYGVLVSAF